MFSLKRYDNVFRVFKFLHIPDTTFKRIKKLTEAIFKVLPVDEKTKSMGAKTKTYFDDIYKTHHDVQSDVSITICYILIFLWLGGIQQLPNGDINHFLSSN